MKNPFLPLLLILFILKGMLLQAQGSDPARKSDPQFGFDQSAWESVVDRWIRSQPVVVAYRKDGGITAGQPIRFGHQDFLIYTELGIPAGEGWQDKIISLPVEEVDSLALQKGGNRVTRAKKASLFNMPADLYYEKSRHKLESSSVYQDSVVADVELSEAFRYSKVLRQVYPRKHLRLSFGVGMGGDVITDDVVSALENSTLGPPDYYYGTQVSLEFVDMAIRFADRFLVGWQYVGIREYTSMWAYHIEDNFNYDYSYDIDFSEFRIYGEVALFPVDRYFTRRFEVLAGAGFLLARPRSNFYYSYYYFEEPDTNLSDYSQFESKASLPGMQLRGAFHYYFFRGLSVFAGLEMNLYQHWTLPEHELPYPWQEQDLSFPAQELVFNSLRFKLGIGIYL
jgi:hypothetical protein